MSFLQKTNKIRVIGDSLLKGVEHENLEVSCYPGLSLAEVLKDPTLYFEKQATSLVVVVLGTNDDVFQLPVLVRRLASYLNTIYKKWIWIPPRRLSIAMIEDLERCGLPIAQFFDGDQDDTAILSADLTHLNENGVRELRDFLLKIE